MKDISKKKKKEECFSRLITSSFVGRKKILWPLEAVYFISVDFQSRTSQTMDWVIMTRNISSLIIFLKIM